MGIEIKKVFVKHFPKVRFIGKMYTNDDRVDGTFGKYWDDWHKRIRNDFKGNDTDWCWFFEGYNDSRMSNEDDRGNVILDYGIYIKTG